jgi:tetratricopeptide (TPR) repeat protein
MISRQIFVLLVSVFTAIPAYAKFEKEQTDIDAMLAKRQYASAASYINDRPDLLKDPRFLRQLSHILVNYYTTTINFGLFALKDLKEGERLEDFRGAKGEHKMVGGDLEKVLHDALKGRPESPDVNFAVGEYLSRGQSCGCGTPQLFLGEQADEYPYFNHAYKGGIYDYWSLFRMGNYYLSEPHVYVTKAVSFYEKSLKLNPDYTETYFNLASIYYSKGDYKTAKLHATKTLGKYSDSTLNADAYANYARIEAALGNRASAETSFLQAFQLKRWHERTFTGLIGLYRTDKRFDAYKKTIKNYIALDYSNTYTFNVYVDYLANAKITDTDREIVRELAKQQFSRTEETGAVFFNLGRIAEMDNDKNLAVQHYRTSLDALKKLREPPPGAITALTQSIVRLQSTDSKK